MRYLLPVFALLTLFSTTIPNGSEFELSFKRTPAQVTPDDDQSVVLNGTLTLENQEEVARVLFMLSRNISDEYAIGDGLSMVMYVLRYMAEIGEYEFVQRDLKALITSFENLLGEPFDPEVWSVVEQIRKLQFARHKGQLAVKIFAMDEDNGVTVMMNTPGEPGSAMKEIEFVRLKHGSRISFSDAESSKDHARVKDLVKDRFKILGFIGLVENDMNLIHPNLIEAIDLHLRREKDELIRPLFIDFDDAFVRVHTSTLFKTIDFKFQEGVCIPGVKTIDGSAAPSFLLTAKSGLLKLKTTVDQ
tara:strand:- start:2118 stop:3026 length:909 start_codon:yes stop_codon:yes gene_type:complete